MSDITQPQVSNDTSVQPQAGNAGEVANANTDVKPTDAPKAEDVKTEKPFSLKVKYNGNEMELDEETARTHVQKGMNYDHIYQELEGYKSDEGYKWLQGVAKQYGVSTADLAKKWGAEIEKNIVNEYADANDLTPDAAKKALMENAEFRQMKAEFDAIKAEREQEKSINAQLKELADAGINVSAITDDIVKLASERGIKLKDAYDLSQGSVKDARIAELEKLLNIKQANDKNANSSMPAVTGAPDNDEEFTEEQIKKMPEAERRAKMPKILKWMYGKKT